MVDKINGLSKEWFYSKSYSDLKSICYDLLFNRELTSIVKEVFYNGNIKKLEAYFNKYNIDFNDYSDKLDKLFINYEFEHINYIEKCNNMISKGKKK